MDRKQKKALIFKENQGFGGDNRDRTGDLLNAIQALSQLSYTPMCIILYHILPKNAIGFRKKKKFSVFSFLPLTIVGDCGILLTE